MLFFVQGLFFVMEDSLRHRLIEYWDKKRIRVFFNKDIEYWGYSRVKFIPFSSLMLDMMRFYSLSEVRFLFNVVSGVKWTKDPVLSGGCYIRFKDYDMSRGSFFSAKSKFVSEKILIPFGDDYYVFNERYIYKIRNKSNKIRS